MKTAILAFVLLAVCYSSAISAPPALAFYIVEDSPGADLVYVDTKEFPKLGYITKTPALVVTSLKVVSNGNPQPWELHDSDGKVVKSGVDLVLIVTFQDADAKAFSALTGQAIHHHLLMAVGDHYISAPMVSYPIPGSSMAISAPTKEELQAIEKELKQFVSK